MANLDGLSDAEASRAKALSDKLKKDFTSAQRADPVPAKDAPHLQARQTDAVLSYALTPTGQTRLQATAAGSHRLEIADKVAARARMEAYKKANRLQRRHDINKEFNLAAASGNNFGPKGNEHDFEL